MAQWQEDLHPRAGKGNPFGGRFVAKSGGWSLDDEDRKDIAKYKTFAGVSAALAWMKGKQSFTEKEKSEISNYSRSAWGLNMKLIKGDQLTPYENITVNTLNKMLSRVTMPDNVRVYRTYKPDGHYADLIKNLNPGDVIHSEGFTSTSLMPVDFHVTPDQKRIEILIPRRSHAGLIGVASDTPSETEVLLPRGAKLEYLGENAIGSKTFKLIDDNADIALQVPTKAKEGVTFVSPNVDSLQFDEAVSGLKTDNQKKFRDAAAYIDSELGMDTSTSDIVGAWTDGAENSVMSVTNNSDWDTLVAGAAMKGWVANQKSVLVFQQTEDGHAVLAKFEAKGSLNNIHERMLIYGIENHTLVPNPNGATVYVVDLDGSMKDNIKAGAKHYDSDIEFETGRAEFIGTEKQDGTDAEQRDSARRVYEGIIEQSPVQGSAKVWQRVRDRWGKTPKVVTNEPDNPLGNPFISAVNRGLDINDSGIYIDPVRASSWLASGSVEELEKQAIDAVVLLGGTTREFGAVVAHAGSEAGNDRTRVGIIKGDSHSVHLGVEFEEGLDKIGARYSLFHNHPKPYPLSTGDIIWSYQHRRFDAIREDDMNGGWSKAEIDRKAIDSKFTDFSVAMQNVYHEIESKALPMVDVSDKIAEFEPKDKTEVPTFMIAHAINTALDHFGLIKYQFHPSTWHTSYLNRFKPQFDRQLELTKEIIAKHMDVGD